MKSLIYILVLAMLATSSANATPADDCTYTYVDDFSTNAVENDSYSHAPILDSFCSSCLRAWLMFVTDSTGNRGLGFYPSQLTRESAFLVYCLPGDGDSGTLEFDLLPTVRLSGEWGFDRAQVVVSCGNDSTDVTTVLSEQMTVPGHYQYSLTLIGSSVWICFLGRIVRLDNLKYESSATVPTLQKSWGGMKSLYR